MFLVSLPRASPQVIDRKNEYVHDVYNSYALSDKSSVSVGTALEVGDGAARCGSKSIVLDVQMLLWITSQLLPLGKCGQS